VAVLLLPLLACLWWRQWSAGGYSYGSYFHDALQQHGGLTKYLTDTLAQAWQYLGGEHVLEMFSPAIRRLGFGRFTQHLPAATVGVIKLFTTLCALALVAMAVIGCRQRWGRSTPYILLVLGFYLLELILWPFALGYRVLYPLVPVLLYWIWNGYLKVGGKWLPAQRLTTLAAVILAANVLLNLVLAIRLERQYAYPDQLTEVKEMAEWITTNTASSNRIAIDAIVPQTHLHYLSQRLFIGGDAGYEPWLRPEMRVEYLIAGAREEKLHLKPGMGARVIYQTHGGLYRVYLLGTPIK
jgi:hypothetical protein